MMRYGIDDVRLFHSADLRFLEQFKWENAMVISLNWIKEYLDLPADSAWSSWLTTHDVHRRGGRCV